MPSAAAAARAHGWKPPAYRHHENGTSGFRRDCGAKYAQAYGVPVEWLIWGVGPAPARLAHPERAAARELLPQGQAVRRRVPVLGDVAAGVWRETPLRKPGDTDEFLRVDVQGYADVELFALRVVGPSMDRLYPEGRWVIVASPAEAGLREDDVVVVRRERAGLEEISLKQLVVEEGQTVLRPRSTHPDFRTSSLPLNGPKPVEIIGVVVGDYGVRDRAGRAIALPSPLG